VALKAVTHEGKADGFFYTSTAAQRYLNDSGIGLETVYSFPVQPEAAITGFGARINGKELAGELMARESAEELYEDALADGDSPVMLCESSSGILTANIGYLAPDDEAEISLTLLELLRFEGDRARISVPTVLAPRSGDMHLEGELRPHESIESSPATGYGLSVSVKIPWQGPGSRVSCPSHVTWCEQETFGLTVRTERGARPDRDFVIVMDRVHPPDPAGCFDFYVEPDGLWARLALFHPDIPKSSDSRRLHVLFDASSTMEEAGRDHGRRIAFRVIDDVLVSGTPCSLYSFNESGVSELWSSGPDYVLDEMDYFDPLYGLKSLGGKGLAMALDAFTVVTEPRAVPPSLLLITDCLEAGLKPLLDVSRQLNSRLFAAAVGHTPLTGRLRLMADVAAKGGVTVSPAPSEDMEEVSNRLVKAIFAAPIRLAVPDWGAQPVWSSQAPSTLMPGATCSMWALFQEPPRRPPSLSWSFHEGGNGSLMTSLPVQPSLHGLPKLLATARLRPNAFAGIEGGTADASVTSGRGDLRPNSAEDLALALRHGLLAAGTAWYAVYRRYPEQKARGIPELQQIPQTVPENRPPLMEYDVHIPESSSSGLLACYDYDPFTAKLDPRFTDGEIRAWTQPANPAPSYSLERPPESKHKPS
jgi:Ca-activated chloride channel family protein